MLMSFVTTEDNPYDFWNNFSDWYAFDTQHGYNTCAYMARIAKTSTEMSDNDYQEEINRAVDDIVRLDLTGNYRRTVRNEIKDEENTPTSEKVDEK